MNPVIVKNVKIGEGIPKICVPIVGVTAEDIISEAKSLEHIPADLVEWRADWYQDILVEGKAEQMLGELRKVIKDLPILFTFRTAKEGGEKEISNLDYTELNKRVVQTGNVDLIDVEIFSEQESIKEIIGYAHEMSVKVVGSNHDFQKTPSEEEVISRLVKMQELGADILKIAVMPQNSRDVITLLSATERMVTEHAKQPVVTMSMSGLGAISRIAGETFGSAITFGSAKKASAPGQIPVMELKKILEIMHG